ncbi:SMN family protein Smn1 [Coniella lustricola]|uniref:SMN family protein Smn1 n=1 Tax=Coniella lustricola TaxID=2025994 RepID=A0A2T2ZW50_9PEZI|nr:SMN family protein Smn1 [Coniella lustricola]
MDGQNNEMTHADIWDDSALVDSWNEALAEYKKYHSIHATGGSIEELVGERDEPLETEPRHNEQSAPYSEVLNRAEADSLETAAGVKDRNTDDASAKDGDIPIENQQARGASGAASLMPPPQALLGSVQDESLKRLLMSWYYAGYYTGLYEGQQKRQPDAAH